MKKSFSSNITTREIKFCPMQGGGNIGASVSLSFRDAEYIRIECQKDRICFIPAKEVSNDGCFYTKYIREQGRVFIPRPILDCYRTVKGGYELLGRTVPRLIVDNGYAAKVKRVKEFNLKDYNISFAKKKMPALDAFVEKTKMTYATSVRTLNKVANSFPSSPYYVVEMFYGEKAGVIITPVADKPKNLSHKNELCNLFGSHFQYCYFNHVSFYVESSKLRIPANWFKRFASYQNKAFSVSVDVKSRKMLIQMKDNCIVDGAETHSAEFNSGERYICNDCLNTANEHDDELLNLVQGLIKSYDKMKGLYEAAEAEKAELRTKLDDAEKTKKILVMDSLKETSGMSDVTKKILKKELAEKEAIIAELNARLDEPKIEVVGIDDFLNGEDDSFDDIIENIDGDFVDDFEID